jgi:hypothetical protein
MPDLIKRKTASTAHLGHFPSGMQVNEDDVYLNDDDTLEQMRRE